MIYLSSTNESLGLAVLKVVDKSGDIAYWLCWREGGKRYYDGDHGEFKGDKLEDDLSDTTDTGEKKAP